MHTTQTHLPYEIEIAIEESDIDQLGHVNNTVYLQWVQDAAIAHWNVIASEEEKNTLLWVVVRHEIDYKRPTLLHDLVVVKTWVGRLNRRHFERFTEIRRAEDSKLLASTLTLWCPVDAKSMKPVRVSDDIKAKFSTVEVE